MTLEKIKSQNELTPKQHASISKNIVKSLMESMYQTGEITDEDFKDFRKLTIKLLAFTKKKQLGMVVDHREDIVETARKYKKEKDYDYATLFYSIYFEHTLNSIIERVCTRNKLDKKTINEILKNVSIEGKLSWLPCLLKIPNINITHKNLIKKNADNRNAFVHYKFNAGHGDPKIENQEEQNRIATINNLEKTVTYLKKYESRIIYNNNKGHFKNNFKKYC